MGYQTDFTGAFEITPTLREEHRAFLVKFTETRRVARNVDPIYGVDGEWYVHGAGDFGQDHEPNITNYNEPPSTQPNLWCQWVSNEEGTALAWDGGEKFYHYAEWLKYLNEQYLKPRGYTLSGEVRGQGEEPTDIGLLRVVDGTVRVLRGVARFEYEEEREA